VTEVPGAAGLPGRTVPRGAWRCIALVSLLTFGLQAYFHPVQAGWNENSRLALTYAICFDGTFRIDAYHRGVVPTSDKAVFGGHYYTEKAPGSSLWAVPACALHAGVGRLLGVPWSVPVSRYVIRVLSLSLPTALFLILFWRVAFALTGDLSASLWTSAAFGLGTQALPYAVVYTGHLLSGMFCFAAFAVGFGLRYRLLGRRPLWGALAGLLLGLAVLTEYQTVLIGAVVLVYVLLSLQRRTEAGAVIAAGLAPMVFLAFYNWVCFGSPFELGYRHVYVPLFREYLAEGVSSLTYPHLTVLYGITISKYRGLFFVSPVLALGFYGWWRMWRLRRWRAEALVVAAVVVVYFAFVSSVHVDQWDGGSAFGPRLLIPMIPFLALLLVFAYRKQGPLFFVLLTISVAAQFMATATQPQPDEATMDPLFEIAVPWFLTTHFDSVTNLGLLAGLGESASLFPLYVFLAVVGLSIFRSAASVGRARPPAA